MFGIFDSGLGGLTVVRAIERRFPEAGYLYLGDTARLPYGTKSPGTIERYAAQALRFLRARGATTPIIACHSVSSVLVAHPTAWKRCERIFGGALLYDVVTPALAAARGATRNGRVGVLGTTATIRSGVYQKALRPMRVTAVAAPVLVSLAEEGWTEPRRVRAILPLLRETVRPLRKARTDTIVLACTHFPLLERPIRAILDSSVRLIDPGEELAKGLADVDIRPGRKHFFATDVPRDFSECASRFLGRPVRAAAVTLS